jgi:hypothetical protein
MVNSFSGGKMELTYRQTQIHERALKIVGRYFEVEADLIDVLQEAEQSKLYRRLDKRSLFKYATDILKLSDAVAYSFIAVARKAKEVPALKTAIAGKIISVSKANKVVAHLTSENANELIHLAATKSVREVEAEIAKRHPGISKPDRVKYINEDRVELTITISSSDLTNLERVASLEAQKGKMLPKGELIALALNTYLEKFDPIRKAERSEQRKESIRAEKQTKTPRQNSSREEFDRQLSAETVHLLYRRDRGGCVHQKENGHRCGSDRWIQFHHIKPVSEGGSNELGNLATLCSFHHRLVHQTQVPRDRQLRWVTSSMAMI